MLASCFPLQQPLLFESKMQRRWWSPNRALYSSSGNASRWQQQQQQQHQHQQRHQSEPRIPCITLHQPWASLLVQGIKRVEGRSWPAPIHGRLWIHAAARAPELAKVETIENFYRHVYSLEGVTDLKFPEHYPVSVLLGSVNVVGCLKREELVGWKGLPYGVRLECLTEFAWLCEDPQKLVVPFEMRGWQGIYNLEKKMASAAEGGLRSVQGPAPVKFPLPDPSDHRSLKPGVFSAISSQSTNHSLNASITGTRAAADQFKTPQHVERQDLSGSSTGAYSSNARSEQPFQSSRTPQPLLSKGQHRLGFQRQPSDVRPDEDHMN